MIWLLKVYQRALQVHPVRTAALSAGTLMTLGDAIAQTLVEKKPLSKFEFKRSLRFLVFGTFLAVRKQSVAHKEIGTLLSLGDVLAQVLVEKRPLDKYDPKRTLRFAIFGTFFGGPLFSIWYTKLARTFGHTRYATLKMVACDQNWQVSVDERCGMSLTAVHLLLRLREKDDYTVQQQKLAKQRFSTSS